jgi:protein-S-isoprenylcysteine O-methyltransferase Ste14
MDRRTAALWRQAWPRQLAFLAFLILVLFAPAGTFRFWQAWLFLVVFVACSIALGLYFAMYDPALLERRMHAGPAAEQEPSQRIIIALLLVDLHVMLLLAGFDRRWHWSDVPGWLSILANIVIVASFVVFFFVLKQNSFAASTVRVEREQTVISTGLYGIVRHPMYAGTLPLIVSIPLALGSYWTLLLVIPLLPILAWRLLDEERVLRRDLPGYADYCLRVRYRLVPGVW